MTNARAMAARLIRECEGCVLHPYRDSAGVWTIGIGSIRIDGRPVTAGTPAITQAKADELLAAEMAQKCDAVDAMVRVPLTDGEAAALYSFAYSLGEGALRGSTLLRKLNAGDRAGAAAEFARWVYAGGRPVKGLQNRRALERGIFLGERTI